MRIVVEFSNFPQGIFLEIVDTEQFVILFWKRVEDGAHVFDEIGSLVIFPPASLLFSD